MTIYWWHIDISFWYRSHKLRKFIDDNNVLPFDLDSKNLEYVLGTNFGNGDTIVILYNTDRINFYQFIVFFDFAFSSDFDRNKFVNLLMTHLISPLTWTAWTSKIYWWQRYLSVWCQLHEIRRVFIKRFIFPSDAITSTYWFDTYKRIYDYNVDHKVLIHLSLTFKSVSVTSITKTFGDFNNKFIYH